MVDYSLAIENGDVAAWRILRKISVGVDRRNTIWRLTRRAASTVIRRELIKESAATFQVSVQPLKSMSRVRCVFPNFLRGDNPRRFYHLLPTVVRNPTNGD